MLKFNSFWKYKQFGTRTKFRRINQKINSVVQENKN